MLTINKLISGGRGLAGVLIRRAAQVELTWDVRQRSRFEAVDSTGRGLAVFLPRGSVVRGGDVLVAEDGALIVVRAAAQAVMRVSSCAEHGTPLDLLRATYHLANRHVALEVAADHLKLEPDHVLAGMLRQQHLIVVETSEPFEPEGGAYASAPHGHELHLEHDHSHARNDDHNHGHGHGPAHVHGPACDHDHGEPTAQHHGPGHDHAGGPHQA